MQINHSSLYLFHNFQNEHPIEKHIKHNFEHIMAVRTSHTYTISTTTLRYIRFTVMNVLCIHQPVGIWIFGHFWWFVLFWYFLNIVLHGEYLHTCAYIVENKNLHCKTYMDNPSYLQISKCTHSYGWYLNRTLDVSAGFQLNNKQVSLSCMVMINNVLSFL